MIRRMILDLLNMIYVHCTITHYEKGTEALFFAFFLRWRGLTDFKVVRSHGRVRFRVRTKDT